MPSSPDASALWDRLRRFDFDGGPAAFTFRDRLARDQGWSRRHADRVVDEYRRFLLLSATAGHPVTPSDAVDEAWHLHLTYTRSYWDDLCGTVLPAPLHHGPTRGGAAEAAKFHDWYERTLASYRQTFAVDPPADVWPPAAVRFGGTRRFARVDTSAVWLLPKPTWRLRRSVATAGAIVAAGATSACSGGSVLAIGVGGLAVLALLAHLVMRTASAAPTSRRRETDGSGGSSGGGDGSTPVVGGGQDCDSSDTGGADCGDSSGGDGGGGGCGGGGD